MRDEIGRQRGWVSRAAGLAIVAGLVFALALAGCRGKVETPLVAVKGKVLGYRGRSVEGVTVTFWPQDAPSSAVKTAICRADGGFSLECPPGTYKVTASPSRGLGQAAVPKPQEERSAVPPKYQSQVTTTLKVVVPVDGAENVLLDLR